MTRYHRIALLWAVVVGLLLAHNGWLWLGRHIVPDSDILALLPVQQRDPVLQRSFTQIVDAAQQRVIVLVGAADWSDATRAADAYAAVLAAAPDLLRATALPDQLQSDWLDQFNSHSVLLMTAAQEAQLRSQPARYWSDAAQALLYSPFAGPKLGSWRDDPFGLFAGWVQQRAQETPVRPRDGRLFVAGAGRQYVLLPLTMTLPALSMDAQQRLLPLLARAKAAALQATPKADLVAAGVVLHAAAAAQQASGEASTIGLGSLLGIVLLMWLAFHSLKPILLILLSIGIGCLGALSVCWLWFGHVHLLTLVFGASLIGVAQDYGIYFLSHRRDAEQQCDSVTLLWRLMPGLLLTLLTTVLGYLGLALTPFPGLRQMALFSGLGLVFAWLTVVCWFPLLVGRTALRSGVLVDGYLNALRHWPLLHRRPVSIAIALIFVVVAAIGIGRLGINDDIRLLQNSPPELVQAQISLSRLLDAPTPVQFYLIRGADPEAVLQREELLKQRLDPLIAQQRLTGYQAMSNWVPSLHTQSARRSLLEEKILGTGGALPLLASQLGEDAAWVASQRERVLQHAAPLDVDGFLRTSASEPWRHLWLGSINGQQASVVALRGVQNNSLPTLYHLADGMDGVQWVDKVGEISGVLGTYRQNMGWVVMASYFLVYLMLFARYRSGTWRLLMPTAAASIGTLALLGYLGQSMQLFHVLALMLLLGVGVDYSLFMHENPGHRASTPWLAIGLSAISTILSFGLLALSKTPALHAFGLTMLIGTALVWLIVPCFGKSTYHVKHD